MMEGAHLRATHSSDRGTYARDPSGKAALAPLGGDMDAIADASAARARRLAKSRYVPGLFRFRKRPAAACARRNLRRIEPKG